MAADNEEKLKEGLRRLDKGIGALVSMLEIARAPARGSGPLDGMPHFVIPEGASVAQWRSRPGIGGEQARVSFPNGYEASVVRGIGTYGVDEGLWELAVCVPGKGLVYDTPITDDVIGHLSVPDVDALLVRIAALPKR